MALQEEFSPKNVLPAGFMNDQQQADSASAWGIKVIASSATTLQLPVVEDGSAEGQTSIRINGQPRYIRAPVSLVMSGSAGTYDIFVTALGAESSAGLSLSASAHPTATPAKSRHVAEVDWDGSAITEIRNVVAAVPGHGGLHVAGGPDPIPDVVYLTGGYEGSESLGFGIEYPKPVSSKLLWVLVESHIPNTAGGTQLTFVVGATPIGTTIRRGIEANDTFPFPLPPEQQFRVDGSGELGGVSLTARYLPFLVG